MNVSTFYIALTFSQSLNYLGNISGANQPTYANLKTNNQDH